MVLQTFVQIGICQNARKIIEFNPIDRLFFLQKTKKIGDNLYFQFTFFSSMYIHFT